MGRSTHIYGREALLRCLRASLRPGALFTLVGPGGVGKTRIAAELDARWIDLQGARTAEDVARALRWAGGDHAGLDEALAALSGTVVLDNLEQLPEDAVVLVGEAVAQAPTVCWVGTSRQPLGVPWEVSLEVTPLDPPDPGDLAGSPAWQLFSDAAGRAVVADPQRALRIVALLDGLPLALELAGARMEVLELDELERRLERDRFAVLADPERADGARHGTVEACLAWSWHLLNDRERRALATLARFASRFDLRLAEAAVGGEDALDLVHRLVRRHLVTRRGGLLMVLDTVRAFVRRASEHGVTEHARAVAAEAIRLVPPGADAISNLDRLAELWPDLERVVDRGGDDPTLGDAALDAAYAMCHLLARRGPMHELERLVDRALVLPSARDDSRAQALRLRARWLRRSDRLAEARADLERAQRLAPNALNIRADLADLALALGADEEALEGYRAIVDRSDEAQRIAVRASMALPLLSLGQAEEASDHVRMAVEEARALGDRVLLADVLRQAGTVALERDRADEARAHLAEARALAVAVGATDQALGLLDGQLGLAEELRGRWDAAVAHLTEGIAALERSGALTFAAYYRGSRGRVRLAAGDPAGALADLVPATESLGSSDDPRLLPLLRAMRIAARAVLGLVDEDADAEWASLAERIAADRAGQRTGSLDLPHMVSPDACTAAAVAGALRFATDAVSAWQVAADGSWHHPPGAARRPIAAVANARLLARLAARRLEAPGAPTSAAELAEAGWPGERIVAAAAGNRVRVAISGLRRSGLEALLQRDRTGWLLDPSVPLVSID